MQPQAIVVLGDFRDPDEAAALVLGSIGFLPGRDRERGRRRQPRSRPASSPATPAGRPGQLESEIAEESWIIEQALPEDVFTDEPDDLWSAVLRRKGGAVRRAGADAARPEQQLSAATSSACYPLIASGAMTSRSPAARLARRLDARGIHYGWVIAAVSFLTLITAAGFRRPSAC